MHKIELKKVIKQSEKMERQHFMVEMRTVTLCTSFHQSFSVDKMLLHLYLLIPCLKHKFYFNFYFILFCLFIIFLYVA